VNMTASVNHDSYSQQICDLLGREYLPTHPNARFQAYRYNSASVRVRVIDPHFKKESISQREAVVWSVLDKLPVEVRGDISMLLLLTPQESEKSLLSLEFDDCTRSGL